MCRRKRTSVSYDEANFNINRMERAVMALMVPNEGLTYDDLLEWLIPTDILVELRKLHRLVHDPGRIITPLLTWPAPKPVGVEFSLDFNVTNVLPPARAVINFQGDAPKAEQWSMVVNEIIETKKQHDKLRTLISWLNNRQVTPGAAKFYFPSLQSLLPSGHAFFNVKGDRFRDVEVTYEISELLREAPEIVAKGLLCNPEANGIGRPVKFASLKVGGGTFQLFQKPL